MRLTLSLLALLFVTPAFAQSNDQVSAADLCKKISRSNIIFGSECTSLISKNRFSSRGLAVCDVVANSNGYFALDCMKAVANNFYDEGAAKTCRIVAGSNAIFAIDCLKASANKQYLNDTASVCQDMARSNAFFAIDCLRKSGQEARADCPSGREIRTVVNGVIDALLRGQARVAIRTLEFLSISLESCE
jgi:hypothetical protein